MTGVPQLAYVISRIRHIAETEEWWCRWRTTCSPHMRQGPTRSSSTYSALRGTRKN
ncbi:hypothetical protein ACIPSA_28300 [Streptomyces sp. NPDC086549]|uniref:hypothetical protein n=1 Tax=Streptomyces sp. NPDC086549 TaxID=3365752 RepID=UPI0037F5CADD